jgi:DNA primase
MFRSILREYSAVCSFGKVLSTRQISLLNEMKTDEIVLCFDGDSAGMKDAWTVIKKWRKYINKKLSMMVLPFGEDPDSCPRIKFDESYENRRVIT